MTYQPKPLDTSDVHLSPNLMVLVEELAENIHDVWAKGRIAEGWVYGARSDTLRQTPCLVPYEALSEAEKDVDRNTCMQTIKLLVKKGYKITKE